jgi:drug/metabolite transporter (DMT)-like permease
MEGVRSRGVLLALGAALGIAGWAVPWKLASAEGAANANALLLLALAAAFNRLYNRLRPRERRALETANWGLAAALAALTLFGNVASALAVRDLSPALLTVAQRGEIIWVALLAWPVNGERPDRPFWIGAAVAAGGLVLLQAPFAAGALRGKPRVTRRSGNPWYDDNVISSIKKASPLPAPPEAGTWTFVFYSDRDV